MGIAGLLQRGEEASAGPALPTLLGCGSERTEHKGKCRTEKPPADHSGGGAHPSGSSQSSVVVGGRGHLQDALSIVLQQGAPPDLPGQQQVLPVQRVDELHLHRSEVREELRNISTPPAEERVWVETLQRAAVSRHASGSGPGPG